MGNKILQIKEKVQEVQSVQEVQFERFKRLKRFELSLLFVGVGAWLFAAAPVVPLYAAVVGESGRTYPIVERDFLDEIKKKAAAIDQTKITNLYKERVKNYKPADMTKLLPAKSDGGFFIDPTYELEFDIPDGKGGILYPKGFKFNPLDYMPGFPTLVVLNAAREAEIKWYRGSPYYGKAKVLITDGKWDEAMKTLGHNVFYYTEPLQRRFGLRHTPSVVKKVDNSLEVKEFYVEEETADSH